MDRLSFHLYMKNFAPAAEYCRIIRVKNIGLSIASVMIRPLQSLMTGIFSLFPLRVFTYLEKSDQHLPSLFSTNFKNVSYADFLAARSC